jgi:hypothetical protein
MSLFVQDIASQNYCVPYRFWGGGFAYRQDVHVEFQYSRFQYSNLKPVN